MHKYQRGHFAEFLAIQAFLTGCSHGHLEVLKDGQTRGRVRPHLSSSSVARYAIPLIDPKGKVDVISLGSEKLLGPKGQLESYLHIRLAAENAVDAVPWTLDPREMKLNFDGISKAVPAYSKTIPVGEILAISMGNHGELDLYFLSGMNSWPLYVDLLWQIHRGRETDTISTRFEPQLSHSTLRKNLPQRVDVNQSAMPEGLDPPRTGSSDHQMMGARSLISSATSAQPRSRTTSNNLECRRLSSRPLATERIIRCASNITKSAGRRTGALP